MATSTVTAPVAVMGDMEYSCDFRGVPVCLMVSGEAMRYVNFAKTRRSEENLREFLEYMCYWVDLRTNRLDLGIEYRDEVLANLWLWARLEHAAKLGDLSRIFHERIQDAKVAKSIFHNRVVDANHYLEVVGKKEPVGRKAWQV